MQNERYLPHLPSALHTPSISEADKTIIAVTELVKELNRTIPSNAAIKARHATALQQLTAILDNGPAPRVGTQPAPRVGTHQSSSADPTAQRTIRATTFIHQRRTRNNIPIPTVDEASPPEPTVRQPQRIQPSRKSTASAISPRQQRRTQRQNKADRYRQRN